VLFEQLARRFDVVLRVSKAVQISSGVWWRYAGGRHGRTSASTSASPSLHLVLLPSARPFVPGALFFLYSCSSASLLAEVFTVPLTIVVVNPVCPGISVVEVQQRGGTAAGRIQ
jgi:hypothetical protein